MTIPNISSYPLPRAEELPANKVHWTPEAGRAALLIHDMQDYFLRFYDSQAEPLSSVLANVARIAAACRAGGVPVLYSAQTPEQTKEERGLLSDMWGAGLTQHPEGRAIVSALAPVDGDIVLTKYRYSAFHRTDLMSILQARGRDQLIVCGVYAHIGCLLTAADAFMNDVQPFFVSDGVADFSADHHRQALTYAAERCAVTLDTGALLSALGAREHAPSLAPDGVRAMFSRVLELAPGELADDDDLFDLGLDSIRLMTLVEELRGVGLHVTFADLAERRSLSEVAELLQASSTQRAAPVSA